VRRSLQIKSQAGSGGNASQTRLADHKSFKTKPIAGSCSQRSEPEGGLL
jgi:hypothetical protein